MIPAEAVLQPADVSANKFESLPEGEAANLRPIRPCDARYPSDATRTAAVARQALVMPPAGGVQTPVALLQYVGRHPGHGPTAFAELVNAVRACPDKLDGDQYTWELVGTDIAGDESVVVRATQLQTYGNPPARPVTTPIVVARVGDYITVVADLGWENINGDEAYVRAMSVKAVDRLRRYG